MPGKKKPVGKRTAVPKKPEKATLPKRTSAPTKKKIAKTTPVKAQGLPIDGSPEERAEAIKQLKKLKEEMKGENNGEALVVQTDSKPKHDKEDKIHDKVSSLIDGLTFDEEDDEAALGEKDELKEAVPAAEGVLRKPEASAESDEKSRASLDTDKAKGELVKATPDEKYQKIREHSVDAEKRKDETKKPDKAEDERVDTEPVAKRKETKAGPVDVKEVKGKKEKIDQAKVEVSEIECGIEEMFSQFGGELEFDKKSRPLLDTGKTTAKTEEVRKTEDALVEMEPVIEDVLSKSEDKTKIAEKPQETITTPSDTGKPKDKIKAIDTPGTILEKKKRHVEHDVKRIEKDKLKAEIKTPYTKAHTGKIKTKRIKRKSSRAIYVFGLVLIILFSAIAFTLFGPADKFNITKTLRSFISHKTGWFPEKPQAQKVALPEQKAVVPEHEAVDLIDSTPSKKMIREKEVIPETEEEKIPGVELEAPPDIEPEVIPEIKKEVIIADEIKEFLMGWKTAWQNTAGAQGDIETYMSFYSDHFISEGLDKNGWENNKVQKNRRKDWIQIELKEINIPETVIDGRVEVSFIQVYTSSNFSDESAKTLVLEKEETGWKIINIKAGRDRSQQAVLSESTTQKDAASLSPKVYPFTIHVASYRDEEKARSFITELKKAGLPAFASLVRIPGKGDWYRISIGVYRTLEEAHLAVSKIKMQKALNAIVAEKPYAIQVGVFDADHSLKAMESNLRSKGYSSYTVPDRYNIGKTRLLIGAFDSEKEAAAQLRKLEDDLFAPKVVKR
ncbi:SPOR domain-containing protein [Thermodesulfobacteriota bacterium]